MSTANNSIGPVRPHAQTQEDHAAFAVPEDLSRRYEVRIIASAQGGERRIGMFLGADNRTPALEIAGERIVARKADTETVASLVKLAAHNHWSRIDVEGSPDFRKAMWTAASREGLSVTGYEPTFVEQERMEALRRVEAERTVRAASPQTVPAVPAAQRAEDVLEVTQAVAGAVARENARPPAHTDGRLAPEPSGETADHARAVTPADDRTMIERAIARSIHSLEQAGDPRALIVRETATALVHQLYSERNSLAAAKSVEREDRPPTAEPAPSGARAQPRHNTSEDLAELFLHGAAQTIATEPRLAGARDAQATMERHIAELFRGDAPGFAAANLESRQMISDVLRRGLDVAVRAPTPVLQIEPIQSPEIER